MPLNAMVVRRRQPRRVILVGGFVVVMLALFASGMAVGTGAVGCVDCHAMQPYAEAHTESTHSGVPCTGCHVEAGALGAAASASRGLGWIAAAAMDTTSVADAVGDSACRSCHAPVLAKTVTASGIRVRHADFAEIRCTQCHAGVGHRLPEGWYLGIQMADCTECHRTSSGNLESCSVCHVDETDAARASGESAWRVTHGPTWPKTHGMGDLRSCTSCHSPAYCARCHEVELPHPSDWPKRHGRAVTTNSDACFRCHESTWCVECHGVPMPHPAGFLPGHGAVVAEESEAVCLKCHSIQTCDECHYRSAHPNVPGVDAGAHGGGTR